MDNYIEYFVKNFIIKDKRERFLYELAKKPRDAEERICHWIDQTLDGRLVVLSSKKLSEEDVLAELKKHTKDKEAYLLFTEYDREIKPLKEAVQICFDWLGGSVLITDGAIFCKEEQCFGAPDKYVLAK